MAPTLRQIRPFHEASVRLICRQPPSQEELRAYLSTFPPVVGTFSLFQHQFNVYSRLPTNAYLEIRFYLNLERSYVKPSDEYFSDEYFSGLVRDYGEIYRIDYDSILSSYGEDVLDDFYTQDKFVQSALDDLTKPLEEGEGALEEGESALEEGEGALEEGEGALEERLQSPAYNELPSILKEPQLDLIGVYRILRRRLNCIRRDPELAKREVFRRLNQVYSAYRQNPNIVSLGVTHAWLFLQCQVLKVYPVPPAHDLTDWIFTRNGEPIWVPYETDTPAENEAAKATMRQEIAAMRREIDTMYGQVRESLECLR
jgi:hypothetical protein